MYRIGSATRHSNEKRGFHAPGTTGPFGAAVADPPTKVAGASIVTILLKDGRSLTREVDDFNGTPARPLNRNALRDKFTALTRIRYGAEAAGLFERRPNLENETDLAWIGA